jgi:hypothetical protein
MVDGNKITITDLEGEILIAHTHIESSTNL